MTNQLIDKFLWLAAFVSIATYLDHFLSDGTNPTLIQKIWGKVKCLWKGAEAEQSAAQQTGQELTVELGASGQDVIDAAPFHVVHLNQSASLMVRYRHRLKVCTAHLLVWSGAKNKVVSDKWFDLGFIEGSEMLSDDVIEEALTRARTHLKEMATQGRQKRRQARKLKQEASPASEEATSQTEVPAVPVEQSVAAPRVEIEDTPPETIKLIRFPPVYRGIITEMGMMTQNKDDREFETFGVRYTTQEGVVEAVFGANLRTALREANAGVGDQVEILKIGRKTVEKGKAPMNLFKVAKIIEQPSQNT